MTKHRLQVAELEQKLSVVSKENSKLVAQIRRYKGLETQIEQDKDALTRCEYQLEQQGEEIEK